VPWPPRTGRDGASGGRPAGPAATAPRVLRLRPSRCLSASARPAVSTVPLPQCLRPSRGLRRLRRVRASVRPAVSAVPPRPRSARPALSARPAVSAVQPPTGPRRDDGRASVRCGLPGGGQAIPAPGNAAQPAYGGLRRRVAARRVPRGHTSRVIISPGKPGGPPVAVSPPSEGAAGRAAPTLGRARGQAV
jgi:hypothetical protein